LKLSSAYLLVSHGSRDPRSTIELEQLAKLVRQQLENNLIDYQPRYLENNGRSARLSTLASKPPSLLVGTACLEAAEIPLNERIVEFSLQAKAYNLKRLQIIPMFLSAGVHVTRDIPTEIFLAQQIVGEQMIIELSPYLGSNLGLSKLVAKQFDRLPAEGRILLAHGSRITTANQSCKAIASQLGAIAAYWSVSPSLAEQIEALAKNGHKRIAIGLYFLFPGGIIDAIAQQVQQLQQAFPDLELLLGKPLGATAQLANLIVESNKNVYEYPKKSEN
jgi:sirohydrochlorin cobaltochelatase